MGLLPVLVYYASVMSSRGGRLLSEFKNRSLRRDLAPVVEECLSQVPPHHSRFTLTAKRKIFCCLMEDGFTYASIVDEALGKGDAFSFLESVRDEFVALLSSRNIGLASAAAGTVDQALMARLGNEFSSTIRVLTLPLIGVPQKEIDSLRGPSMSPSPNNNNLSADFNEEQEPGGAASTSMTHPLYSSSERSDGVPEYGRSGSRALGRLLSIKSKRSSMVTPEIRLSTRHQQQQDDRVEVVVVDNGTAATNGVGGTSSSNETMVSGAGATGGGSTDIDLYPHSKSFSVREAENRWWRNLKIVLALDLVVCVVLFAVWLGVCRGFDCVSS